MRLFVLKDTGFTQKSRTSPEEHNKISETAHHLCLWAVSNIFNIPISDITIDTIEGGKPIIKGVDGVHISISHSGAYVLCAVGDKCVGVDIEKLREVNTGVLRKMFSPMEISFIEASDDKDRAYTEIWTVKEAFGKYHGTGLFGGVSLMDVSEQCRDSGLFVRTFRTDDDYFFSAVSSDNEAEVIRVIKTDNGFAIE